MFHIVEQENIPFAAGQVFRTKGGKVITVNGVGPKQVRYTITDPGRYTRDARDNHAALSHYIRGGGFELTDDIDSKRDKALDDLYEAAKAAYLLGIDRTDIQDIARYAIEDGRLQRLTEAMLRG